MGVVVRQRGAYPGETQTCLGCYLAGATLHEFTPDDGNVLHGDHVPGDAGSAPSDAGRALDMRTNDCLRGRGASYLALCFFTCWLAPGPVVSAAG